VEYGNARKHGRGIRERYREYKAEFQIADCQRCSTTRLAPSWDLDVAAMVHKIGAPFINIYFVGYALPNLKIHATYASAMADFEQEKRQDLQARARYKRDDGEFVMSLATAVFIQVMRSQNTIFGLGLDKELDQCDQDVIDVWTPHFLRPKQ
jgi:hypothetical protein